MEILRAAIAHGASDVHLKSGSPPLLRVDGDLRALDLPVLADDDVRQLVQSVLSGDRERAEFEREGECDTALSLPDLGRFRVSAFHARGTEAMVLRHVREEVPTPARLGLPSVVRDFALAPSGLVLVCGPTGSGKTTTLASLVEVINAERPCHILTIEDPIEFLHRDVRATISQRELHTDTRSFSRALRSGLRQDPDVILVGEIRDVETLRTALQAAETGHLVLASLHARSAVDAIHRVIDLFPVEEQRQARASLAESLQGVICQFLVSSAAGPGRCLVTEVAVATPRVRDAIASVEHTASLGDIVAEGDYYGMHTFEQDAVRQVLAGRIAVDQAERVVPRVADLHVALRRAGYREVKD
jgi:twitching motility protein PilT